MYGGILYWLVYFFLYFLLLKNDEYRNLAIGLLAVLVLAAWLTKKRWLPRLKGRYVQLGILVSEEKFKSMFCDMVWLGLELYLMIFLVLIPGFLSVSTLAEDIGAFGVLVIIFLVVITFCDLQLDLLLTGERERPPLWIRIMPVSMAVSAAAILFEKVQGERAAQMKIPLYLILLFLIEMLSNLVIRRILQKRREKTDSFPNMQAARELELTSWLVLWISLVEVWPLLPLFSKGEIQDFKMAAVLFLIFAVQTVCVILFFRKRAAWTSAVKTYMKYADLTGQGVESGEKDTVELVIMAFLIVCWIFFGNILPNFLYPGCVSFSRAFFFTFVPMIFLLTSCLNAPLYGIITGSPDMPAARWRLPYFTSAAAVYAVIKVPMPWTDARIPLSIAALGLLEILVLVLVRRLYWKKKMKF